MSKKILIIEANDEDFLLLENILKNIFSFDLQIHRCVSFEDSFLIPLLDIKIIILGLPILDITDPLAYKLIHIHFQDTPLIINTHIDSIQKNFSNLTDGAVILEKGRLEKILLEAAISEAILRKNTFKLELKHTDFKRHFYKGEVPMWIFDTETLQILDVNHAAILKYGYLREEFLTMTIVDFLPKEDVDSFIENLEAREDAQFDFGYWRQIKKNGEIIFANLYCHYTDFENKETGLTFAFDVTENLLSDLSNKNTQNLAKGQKEQFDTILSTLSDAVWSIKADSLELIYANQAFYELFGFSPEEMSENIDPFFSCIHPDDQKMFRVTMQRVTYSQSSRLEYRFNHRDGGMRIFQVHVSLIKGAEGKPDTLNGVTMDITNERLLQEKIRKSEQNLLATINNTKDLIWSVNTNLEIIFCNKPYQEYVYNICRVVPRPGDFVLGEWEAAAFVSARKKDYERALKGEYFITVIDEKVGNEITFREFSNNPIIDQDGKIIGVNCIARDITEQRKQFIKIREQNEKLMEIAWIQSHKVRSPVAVILGLADLIDRNASLDENLEILDLILNSTKDLDKIIREVVEKSESLNN